MGLLVDIFSCPSYGHPAGRFLDLKGLCLTNVSGPFEPDARYPAAKLVPGHLKGTVRVVMDPEKRPGLCGPMFGGSYVACSDSRFSEAVERMLGHRFNGAVPLHDHYEG